MRVVPGGDPIIIETHNSIQDLIYSIRSRTNLYQRPIWYLSPIILSILGSLALLYLLGILTLSRLQGTIYFNQMTSHGSWLVTKQYVFRSFQGSSLVSSEIKDPE
jgi:hypothetical protein